MLSNDSKARLRFGMQCLLGSCGLLLLLVLMKGGTSAVPFLGTILAQVAYLGFVVGCGLCAATASRGLARAQAIAAAICMALAAVVSIARLVDSSPPDPDSVGFQPGLQLLALSFIGFSLLTEENANRGYALPVMALLLGVLALVVAVKPRDFPNAMGIAPYLPLPVLAVWLVMIFVRLPKLP